MYAHLFFKKKVLFAFSATPPHLWLRIYVVGQGYLRGCVRIMFKTHFRAPFSFSVPLSLGIRWLLGACTWPGGGHVLQGHHIAWEFTALQHVHPESHPRGQSGASGDQVWLAPLC
jgi:hypothetical protein